jgi:hypothetical protein
MTKHTDPDGGSKAKRGAFDKFKEGWLLALARNRDNDKPQTVTDHAIAIARHFNRGAFLRGEKELAFPSIAKIAALTGLGRRTIIRNNAWLEARGFLAIRRRRAGLKNLANVYTPTMPVALGGVTRGTTGSVTRGTTGSVTRGTLTSEAEPLTEPLTLSKIATADAVAVKEGSAIKKQRFQKQKRRGHPR